MASHHHPVHRGRFSLVSVRTAGKILFYQNKLCSLKVMVVPSMPPSMWCVSFTVHYFPITIPGKISISERLQSRGKKYKTKHCIIHRAQRIEKEKKKMVTSTWDSISSLSLGRGKSCLILSSLVHIFVVKSVLFCFVSLQSTRKESAASKQI